MDTTIKYIKLCEKAQDIQKKAPHGETGNWFYHELKIPQSSGYRGGVFIEAHECHGATTIWENYFDKSKRWVWLPRQDQLQEMILGKGHLKSGVLVMLSLFADEYKYNDYSFEQLWLAFVMHEKFGKVWDNEKGIWAEEVK